MPELWANVGGEDESPLDYKEENDKQCWPLLAKDCIGKTLMLGRRNREEKYETGDEDG